jgi:hypothetical protein
MSAQDKIRDAVVAGDFPRAALRFEEHARSVCAALRSGAAGAAEVEDTRALLEWCRMMALAWRAHLAGRLRTVEAQVYVAHAYEECQLTPRE